MNLLRHRDFGLLWWAGFISLTGTWALRVALPVAVLGRAGSVAAVSSVVAAAMLGGLLSATFGGAWVDRWDRRRCLVMVNMLQVGVLSLLLIAHATWLFALVAFAEAGLAHLAQSAENALLPRLVSPDDLAAANAWQAMNNNTGRLLGPAIGGALALGQVVIADAATFAVSAMMCAAIGGKHRVGGRHSSVMNELREGLAAVREHRMVRAILVLLALTAAGDGMVTALFAVFVAKALHANGSEVGADMGAMMSAQALGGIFSALASTRYAPRFRPVPTIAVCYALFGLIDLAIFNYPRVDTHVWPVIAMFFLAGLPVGVHVGLIWALFQAATPDRLRGRLFGAIWTGAALAALAGTALAALLGDRVEVLNLLSLPGIGCVVAAFLFARLASGVTHEGGGGDG